MAQQALKYITSSDYLTFERNATEKHEYFNGEIIAMARGTKEHNLIVANLIGELHAFLKGNSCNVYPSDIRLATPLFESYMYPDVSVVCGESEMKDDTFDTLMNPSVVIEVMSKTTEQNDRGYKFFYYQQIQSLKEYILIDSNSYKVEIINLQEDRSWKITKIDGINGVLAIDSIGMVLPLKDIYDRVSF